LTNIQAYAKMSIMSKESFGPQSTNPRQRRAYAHAVIHRAITSGRPETKVKAVEAAVAVSGTNKGQGLARNAIGAVANDRLAGLGDIFRAHGPSDAWDGSYKGWVSEGIVKRRELAAKALGAESTKGITYIKPESDEQYLQAAQELVADRDRRPGPRMIDADGRPRVQIGPQQLAEHAVAEQLYLERVDWSVPGTAQIYDTAQALGHDTSHRHAQPHNPQKH
jgi:hypothetical protein